MSYKFQKYLEAATDQTLVEPNWEAILECVDAIRGGEVPVKESVKAIQKRYHSPNPHIAHHALLILEACVKNCGKKFVLEIATKEFMDDLKNMVISNQSEKVKEKILELIQCWTSAFKGISEYKIVEDTHSLLKMNGFEFPPIDEAKAMFLADSAPDWAEGDNCYRCRVEFGVFTRKHHCRACGQIFCDKCSSKQILLPQFGIEKKVRVCEACFDKNSNATLAKTKAKIDNGDGNKSEAEAREKARKEAEAKEQEELQLALAISQSEAEAKEREKWSSSYYSQWGDMDKPAEKENINRKQEETNIVREEETLTGMGDELQEQPFDPVLAKYLDRDYWERKRRETEEEVARATAPPPSEISISISSSVSQRQPNINGVSKNEPATNYSSIAAQIDPIIGGPPLLENKMKQQQQRQADELTTVYAKMDFNEIEPKEIEDLESEEQVAETSDFCRALKERVDTLSTRMRSNQLRGRSIVNDSAIHSLFSQLTDAHAKVLERMTKLEGQREHFERLQDHLGHIGEARQAVNALREESERQRQELLREEQNRRQVQLRQKLELMRHKKHEMLLNERQVAIQRFQQNERQILQQRMMHQQSPLTVSGIAVKELSPNPQMNQQQMQQFVSMAPNQFPMQPPASSNQQMLPQDQIYNSNPANQHQQQHSQYVMATHHQSTQSYAAAAQPHMIYQQSAPHIGGPLYQMPPQSMAQQQNPMLYHHQQSIPPNVFPPLVHHQPYPMPAYPPQQFIPNNTLPHVQDPPRQAAEEPPKETANVVEDLLISFD